MSSWKPTFATAADVVAALQRCQLAEIKRRDMISAVKRVCELIGCDAGAVRMNPTELRKQLAGVRPGAHGIAAKTFSNIRSRFGAALETVGILESVDAGAAHRSPDWAPLINAIATDKRLSHGMSRFFNWAAENGIPPSAIDDETLWRFLEWLEQKTIYAKPRDYVRPIPRFWTEAQSKLPSWPRQSLTRISFRPASQNLRWEDLHAVLRAEAEDYLRARAEPDIFDTEPGTPTRPLASSTIRQQREHIRLAASVLSREERAPTGLAALVQESAFKAVLGHYRPKARGEVSAFAICLAKTLVDVGHYFVRLPDVQLQKLRKMAANLPAVLHDLSAKNKGLLRQLESEEVRGRLLFLPERLITRTKAALKKGILQHADAQVAIAVAILLVAPIRPQNLIRLNRSRHFQETRSGSGGMLLYIPKAETKSGKRDLTFEIPEEIADDIRWYCREILPRIGGGSVGDLFVTETGRQKSQETLSQQITEVIAEEVGIWMTPHQFRHLAASLYLEQHPEDFQSVTDLLGHAWSKTTAIYTGTSSRRASRSYSKLVFAQREALGLKRRRRRRSSPCAR